MKIGCQLIYPVCYVSMLCIVPLCCLVDSNLPCSLNGSIPDATCDKTRTGVQAGVPEMNELYGRIVVYLFKMWERPLDDVIVICDEAMKDISYALIKGLPSRTKILYEEIRKGDDDGLEAFSGARFASDSTNFVFIIPSSFYNTMLKEIDELKLNLPSYVWIFISPDQQVSSDICWMHETTNIYILDILRQVSNKSQLQSTDPVYKVDVKECTGNETDYLFSQVAEWNSTGGLEKSNDFLKVPSKIPYLRVVGLHEAPYIYVKGINYTGYHVDILDHISKEIGFKYVMANCDQNLYGFLDNDTNQWSGCVSDIVYGRADIIAAPLHLVSVREAVIDYIIPWSGYSGIVILAKKQNRELFFFVEVFTPELWLAILATLVLSSLFVIGFGKALSKFKTSEDEHECGRAIHNNSNFHEAMWFFMSSTAFEGTRSRPQSHSARILIAGFWFFVQIIMSVFLANMAAFLMSSKLRSEILSFKDLIDQHTVKFSVWRDSSISAHISDMSKIERIIDEKWTNSNLYNRSYSAADFNVWTNPLSFRYTKLWERIIQYGFVDTTTEAVQRIYAGNFMFVTDSAVAEFLADNDCNLQSIGQRISSIPYGFAIRKHSSFKIPISKAILELQHSSKMYEIRKKWFTKERDCPGVNEDKGLQFSEMTGTFSFAVAGIGIGLFGLACELFFYKMSTKLRKMKDNGSGLEL